MNSVVPHSTNLTKSTLPTYPFLRYTGWVSQSPLSKKELLSRLSGERADPLSSFEIWLCPGLLIVMQRKIGRDTLLCALVLDRSSFLERDGSCFSRLLSRETGMLLFAPWTASELTSFTLLDKRDCLYSRRSLALRKLLTPSSSWPRPRHSLSSSPNTYDRYGWGNVCPTKWCLYFIRYLRDLKWLPALREFEALPHESCLPTLAYSVLRAVIGRSYS